MPWWRRGMKFACCLPCVTSGLDAEPFSNKGNIQNFKPENLTTKGKPPTLKKPTPPKAGNLAEGLEPKATFGSCYE